MDGNFGKGGCGGYWLIINALDGSGSPWPLVITWSERPESHESWGAPIQALSKACPGIVVEGNKVLFMSDDHPSIKAGLSRFFPDAVHQLCAWHYAGNVADRYGKGAKAVFWAFIKLPDKAQPSALEVCA